MKKRRGNKQPPKIDADLDDEVVNYEPSDSEDGFDDDDRELLRNAVGRKVQKGEEEVLKVYSSSDNSDEDEAEEEDDGDSDSDKELYGGGVGSDMDSDIEEKDEDDGLPDAKAWGSDRKQYYDTDYVDKDYLGFDDEDAAIEEEKEADAIQRRLLSHLEGTDFTLGLLDTVEEKKKEAAMKRDRSEMEEVEEKVEVDLSKLSKDEYIELIKRKNPELFPLIEQCKEQMKYLEEKVAPILELVQNNTLRRSKVIDFLETLHQIILHYAVNVLFYVHLKEQGVHTDGHSVIKRLEGLNFLIQEMDIIRNNVDPEIDIILEKAANGEELNAEEEPAPPEPEPKNRKERRKKKLDLLRKKEEFKKAVDLVEKKLKRAQEHVSFEQALSKRAKKEEEEVVYSEEDSDEEGSDDEENGNKETVSAEEKRKITFEMMKNKGLTPRRKKENRNPRVKHRNKFKKAIVRRKGQVRGPRKELQKYGGEISGINARVTKSIRIK